ncbi:MAG: TetR family transcriptional regulator [Acidimicrobiia bacterium]
MVRKVTDSVPPTPAVGLRERKRLRTRAAIQAAGLHLFAAQGYDATTCEQIAAAAEVSPATFFRYFPTKEDVVLSDDYDDLLLALLQDRPPRESPVQAVRRSLAAGLEAIYAADAELIRERLQLVLSVPALRARRYEQQRATERLLADGLAARIQCSPDDLETRVVAAAIAATVVVAVEEWAEQRGELPELMDRALTALELRLGHHRSRTAR